MSDEKRELNTRNTGALIDLKAEYLNRKRDAKRTQLTNVQLGKSSVLTITRTEKEAKKEQQEQRRRVIAQHEELIRKEDAQRDQQRKTMEEKARLYDKMTSGGEMLYDDGSRAEFLVNFHEKKREIDDAADERKHNDYEDAGPSEERVPTPPLIVHYNPQDDLGRIFGPSHAPLPRDEDERAQHIAHLKETSKQTEALRKKRKKQMSDKKRAEREKTKRFRRKLNLSPLPSTSEESTDEEDEQQTATSGPSLDSIPLPDLPPAKTSAKLGAREWDREKWGHNRWLSEQRDQRDDEFAPPTSYNETNRRYKRY